MTREVFADSLFLPFALCLIGVLIIYGGVKFQHQEDRIESVLTGFVPKSVRHMLPIERSDHARDKGGARARDDRGSR